MKNTIKNIGDLASEVLEHFERKTRDNGKEFYCLKNHKKEWLVNLVHDAHGEVMPNDYIYEFIVEALDVIAECETVEEAEEKPFEGYLEPDVYNSDLLKWVSDNLTFSNYVDEAMQELDIKEFFPALMEGQAKHKREVYYYVLESLKEELDKRNIN